MTDPVLGEVEILFKTIKNIYIAVLPPDGYVRISAPVGTPLAVLQTLLMQKRSWVLKKRDDLKKRPPLKEMQFVSGETFWLFGDAFTLYVQSGSRFGLELDANEKAAYLTVKNGADLEKTKAFVSKWQRDVLHSEIEQRLPVWEKRTGLCCNSWQIKNMKTRWGTCNTLEKRLWFNLKLVQKPLVCLDYVILHELAHLRYSNHSKAFWLFVQSFMPQWREIQNMLNGKDLSDKG